MNISKMLPSGNDVFKFSFKTRHWKWENFGFISYWKTNQSSPISYTGERAFLQSTQSVPLGSKECTDDLRAATGMHGVCTDECPLTQHRYHYAHDGDSLPDEVPREEHEAELGGPGLMSAPMARKQWGLAGHHGSNLDSVASNTGIRFRI